MFLKINSLLLTFGLIILFVDMGGELGVRSVAFLIFLIHLFCGILSNANIRISIREYIVLALVLSYSTLMLLASILKGYDAQLAISQVNVFFFFVFYFLARKYNVNIDGISKINYSFVAIACFYLVMLLLFLTGSSLYFEVTDYIHDKGAGYAGIRNDDSISLANVYLKSSLFLIFTFFYYIGKNIKMSLLIFVGSFITTSKVLFVVQFLSFATLAMKNRHLSVLFIFVIGMSCYFFYDDLLLYLDYLYATISGGSDSFNVRMQHLVDLYEYYGDDGSSIIFGSGPGSTFYSNVFGPNTANIEIDHLNVIRKFGLVFFILFTMVVLFVCIELYFINKSNIMLGLGFSFILSGTNPVLLSPVFVVILVECYLLVVKNKRVDGFYNAL